MDEAGVISCSVMSGGGFIQGAREMKHIVMNNRGLNG